jgi:vancomycin permeability regulator SanA
MLLRTLWRRRLLVGALGAALMLALTLIAVAYVHISTRDQRYTEAEAEQVPPARVALVFGAGLRADGRPTRMLADRVRAAATLYEMDRVHKLLLTGDNSSLAYNEVAAMQRYAVELGVPVADTTLDYAGFSTYESCYRAREIFGVEQAVLITQRYHLPRAVYTCRALGVDAVGMGTTDWGAYHPALIIRYTAREMLATLNALIQVHLTRPLPTFLGPFEGIS